MEAQQVNEWQVCPCRFDRIRRVSSIISFRVNIKSSDATILTPVNRPASLLKSLQTDNLNWQCLSSFKNSPQNPKKRYWLMNTTINTKHTTAIGICKEIRLWKGSAFKALNILHKLADKSTLLPSVLGEELIKTWWNREQSTWKIKLPKQQGCKLCLVKSYQIINSNS